MPFSLKRFKTHQAGQVVVLFAFMLVPICTVCGFALDYQMALQRAQKVQAVLDSAVLAAARTKQSGASAADTEIALANFVTPQISDLGGLDCDPPDVTLTSDSQILAEIECVQDTSLMHLVGAEEMPFLVKAASHYTVGQLDVAFMFDTSMSMNAENRLRHLKVAATEAIDVLLPVGASPELIENTRVAMSSYSTMLNAGPYFEQVTGATPTRTYYHTSETKLTDNDLSDGHQVGEMFIGLYDTDTGKLIAELGDGAVIRVKQASLDDMSIAVTFDSSHSLQSEVESIRLELSGEETVDQTENVPPYSLYGDSGINNLDGERWQTGDYTLRVRAHKKDNLLGLKVFDEELDFKLFVQGDTKTDSKSFEYTSTCVYSRDGTEAFTDATPGPGAYLAYQQAWFKSDTRHPDGGYWQVGYNKHGEHKRLSDRCQTQPPVELTNDRTTLIDYVASLTTDAYTAGHLGVAWSWYLISDQWGSIFDGDATPVAFTDSETEKAVVLMTDGAFNYAPYARQGRSPEQARALCDNMKLKGVTIYAVAFKASSSGQDVLKHCVTDLTFYFDAQNGDDLKKAYKEIALLLSDLRISQ